MYLLPPFPGAVLGKALNVRVHLGELMEGHSVGLLSGGDAYLEQASLNT